MMILIPTILYLFSWQTGVAGTTFKTGYEKRFDRQAKSRTFDRPAESRTFDRPDEEVTVTRTET